MAGVANQPVPNVKVQHLLIYDTVRGLLRAQKMAPTVDEIAEASEVSISIATSAVNRLVALGFLSRTPGKYRTLQLTDKRPPKVRVS